ncbi:hypothetical protein N658DRAFT_515904 [Parathielavia hyrcaniae]|uniref:Uncharacterized protein n=1 Tax=Parathielavia hyrcaniae TaxID=113614 RepID=A0AAN6Q243_9PEZI|nr:hypothetical protein N658DRAFT_515904 [Parathielavia hyrcaniae]
MSSGTSARASAAQELSALLSPLAEDAPSVPGTRNILSAIESLLLSLTPDRPLFAAFHDGQVHDPLGAGAYTFRDDLIGPLVFNLVHDEVLSSADDGSNPKAQAARPYLGMPSRPIVIHAGAQPNNSPHCGTLIVFSYAFAVARAIRDRLHAMAAEAGSAAQPPPVSVEITFVDTAPVNSEDLKIDGIHYQKSYRDTSDAFAAWLGDYHEVLGLLSGWSGIPFTTPFQSNFFSNPHMPELVEYLVKNRHVLGRQLSPKHGTLALRATCPVAGCSLAEKHGRLNRYTTAASNSTTIIPPSSPGTATATTPEPTPTPTTITFSCPHHGPHTLQLTTTNSSSRPSTARLEANAPTRNLLRSMAHLVDKTTHHIRVTGADYAGTYQEALLYRPLAEWSASTSSAKSSTAGNKAAGRTPHILYAPLVVDWSGAKLSKSLYVCEGGYEGMKVLGSDGLLSWRVLKEQVGGGGGGGEEEEGLRRIWDEVVRWVEDPKKGFRCWSVEYLRRVVLEGRGWEAGTAPGAEVLEKKV